MIKNRSGSYNLDKKSNNSSFKYSKLNKEPISVYRKLPNEGNDEKEFPSLNDECSARDKARKQKQALKAKMLLHNVADLGFNERCDDINCEVCKGTGTTSEEAIDKYNELKRRQHGVEQRKIINRL